MGFRLFLAAVACLGLAAAPVQAAQRVQIVDLVGEFDAVIDRTASLPPTEQAVALRERFATLLPGFYDAARLGQDKAAYDARLAREMNGYRQFAKPKAAAVRDRFNRMIQPAVSDFERTVGPLPEGSKAYLVISMGEFDGATRTLPQVGQVLLFGADMIAKYHGDSDARAFVQHELFHVYHGQRFEGCEQVWCSLWQEGLATYVAARLNPRASDAELLLTIPEPIRPSLDKHKVEAVCAVLERLDSTRDDQALFSFKRLSPNLPPRFGYLVGAWVAEDLGKRHSLPALAEMKGKPLRSAIEQSLKSMADCSRAARTP